MAINEASYLKMADETQYDHFGTLLLHKTFASFWLKYGVCVFGNLFLS